MNRKATTRNSFFKGFSLLHEISLAADAWERAAAKAYAWGDYETVRANGFLLIESNIPAYACVGNMYVGLALLRSGKVEEAIIYLERALYLATPKHIKRIKLAHSLIYVQKGNYDARARVCESLINADEPYVRFEALRAMAVMRAIQGQHTQALDILSSTLPPFGTLSYGDWLNSYAVEACELGQIENARKASSIALALPWANANPQWKQTGLRIVENTPAGNLLAFPVAPLNRANEWESFKQTLDLYGPMATGEQWRDLRICAEKVLS